MRERAVDFGKQRGLSEEALKQVLGEVRSPGELADLVATHLELPTTEKRGLLETLGVEERLRRVLVELQRKIQELSAQQKIRDSVTEEIGNRQREMYLREQLKAIHKSSATRSRTTRSRPCARSSKSSSCPSPRG